MNAAPQGCLPCPASDLPAQQRHEGHHRVLRALPGLLCGEDPVLGLEEVHQGEPGDRLRHEECG